MMPIGHVYAFIVGSPAQVLVQRQAQVFNCFYLYDICSVERDGVRFSSLSSPVEERELILCQIECETIQSIEFSEQADVVQHIGPILIFVVVVIEYGSVIGVHSRSQHRLIRHQVILRHRFITQFASHLYNTHTVHTNLIALT